MGGVMQLLLLSMSAHLTKQLGMAPGGEFRRAVQEVKQQVSSLIFEVGYLQRMFLHINSLLPIEQSEQFI